MNFDLISKSQRPDIRQQTVSANDQIKPTRLSTTKLTITPASSSTMPVMESLKIFSIQPAGLIPPAGLT